MRRKVIVLLLLVVVAVAGWSYAWKRVHDTVLVALDTAVGDLAAKGVAIDCPERTSGGWPFRITITCTNPQVRLADGGSVKAARLEANGVVADPNLVVLRIGAPLMLTGPDGSHADATFADLRASIRLADGRLARFSMEGEDLAVNGVVADRSLGRVTAREGEVHVAPDPSGTGDLDLAVMLTDANATAGSALLLPAEADAGATVIVRRAPLLDGTAEGVAAWKAAGGEIGVTEMALEVGETRLSASGSATADDEGRLEGRLTVDGSGLSWLTKQVSSGKPLAAPLGALGTAFIIFGKAVDGAPETRRLTVDFAEGGVRAAGFDLGAAPRLY